MNKAVFWDKDDTLIHMVGNTSAKNWADTKWIDGAKDALRYAKERGYLNIIVTNQPDESASPYLEEFRMAVQKAGLVDIMAWAVPELKHFYKPAPGMIETQINYRDLDRSKCFMVGDRWKDVVAGHRAGVRTVFIGQKYTCPDEHLSILPDFVFTTISQIRDIL